MAEPDLLPLHRALLEGNPTAPRDLVNACRSRLYAVLKHKYSVLPREVVEDAVNDALLAIINRPDSYDPARGSLMNLMANIGGHKLSDHLRRARRRSREIAAGGVVELAQLEAKYFNENPSAAPESDQLPPELESLLAEILPDPTDRRVWDLVCSGHRPVEEFAVVLKLGELPPERMKAEVKRHRDRVVKKVQPRREEFRRYLL